MGRGILTARCSRCGVGIYYALTQSLDKCKSCETIATQAATIEALSGELSQSRDHIIEQERSIVGRAKRIAELEDENAGLLAAADTIDTLTAEHTALMEAARATQKTLDEMLSDQNTYRFEGTYMEDMWERLYAHHDALAALIDGGD